jgi:hypothetical protein
MSTYLPARAAPWPTSEQYAASLRRKTFIVSAVGLALAMVYAIAIVVTEGKALLLAPLVGLLIAVAICARPLVGVYLAFGAAILFEQYGIIGISPITTSLHFFQNLSSYTDIPIRLSLGDLLILLTLGSWGVRCLARPKEWRLQLGRFGWAVTVFLLALGFGLLVGVARGSGWDPNAAFQELRAPGQMCAMYFLTANLVRTRGQLVLLTWDLVALVGLKSIQAVLNYQDSMAMSVELEAVTGHEDVIFMDLAIALMVVIAVLGARTKILYALIALSPVFLAAEFVTERRVGFVALGAVVFAIAILSIVGNARRAAVLGALGCVLVCGYLLFFWNETGPLGQPARALRGVIDPAGKTERDSASDRWRAIENRNIAFTMRQVPLTGVGVGQQYLFAQEPPALGNPKFIYWRNLTHDGVLWLWLKAGPLGAFALWFLVARVLLLGSATFVRLRDPFLRSIAALPVAVIVIWFTFSTVEPGFAFTRAALFLGTVLGLGAALTALSRPVRSEVR